MITERLKPRFTDRLGLGTKHRHSINKQVEYHPFYGGIAYEPYSFST